MSAAAALRGYVALGSARLRAMLQYRAVALAALATQVFWGLLRLMILDGFYRSAPDASDFSSMHYVSYIWLGQALFGLFPLSVGTFDRVLLRPRSTLLQVLGAALAPATIGRLLLATLVLGWALAALDGGPVAADVALLLWAFAGGVAAFFALLMLSAALSFWTTGTLLIFAIVTKGGLETTQYPIAVFHRALRYLFLFLVPIGTVTYFPVAHVLGRPDPLGTSAVVAWLAPLAGFVFLTLVAGIWQLGVRRYTSTGS